MAVYDNFMHVYIVVIKLLVFLVSNVASGYITRVDELEVILLDFFCWGTSTHKGSNVVNGVNVS